MLGILLLAVSTTLMIIAVLRRMEGTLLAAVIAYAGTGFYIIELESWLLPATLLVALAVGVMALLRHALALGRPRLPDRAADVSFFTDGG